MRRYLFFYYFLQESARDKTQKFKEGKFILDRFYSSKLLFISYAREKYKKKAQPRIYYSTEEWLMMELIHNTTLTLPALLTLKNAHTWW